MAGKTKGYNLQSLISKLRTGASKIEEEEEGDVTKGLPDINKLERQKNKLQKMISEGKGDKEKLKEKMRSLEGIERRLYGGGMGLPQGPMDVRGAMRNLGRQVTPEKETTEKGIDLPRKGLEKGTTVGEEEGGLSDIDEYYSIVPRNPGENEDIYTYAHITWDNEKDSLVYNVIEPDLSESDKELVEDIKNELEEKLDVDFEKLGKVEASEYLRERVEEVLEGMERSLSGERKKAIKYFLQRDFLGLERVEPLMKDPNIEDISCDGVDIPIYVWHRNPRYGSMETNIRFKDKDVLDSFVRRLAQRSRKSISMADPLVDAALPDGSRLQATLGTDIARRGSNFTIRKFTESPLTPVDLIEFGTVDPRTLAYLWLAIEHQKSALISGGTATGKTTLLNVVSLFIRPQMKIVTIEDTPELRLPHDHWIPEVAREPISEEGGKDVGSVDMYKLLKESLRQRPDYIIVGEVRGKEAFVLFQQMATGHPGLSTVHSENLERLVDRLTTDPIDLPPSLLENLDIMIFLDKTRRGGNFVRRINQVLEMKRYDRDSDKPIVNELFKWDPKKDKIGSENSSAVLKEIAREEGIEEDDIKRDLKDRIKVIEWMVERGIKNLDSINRIIEMYDSNKENLMAKIESSW